MLGSCEVGLWAYVIFGLVCRHRSAGVQRPPVTSPRLTRGAGPGRRGEGESGDWGFRWEREEGAAAPTCRGCGARRCRPDLLRPRRRPAGPIRLLSGGRGGRAGASGGPGAKTRAG